MLGLLGAQLWWKTGLELNPEFNTWQEVPGVWKNSYTTLTLQKDHRFEFVSDSEGMKGRWNCDDWNLKLDVEGGKGEGAHDFVVEMRFIRFRGQLRIVPGNTVNIGVEELFRALRKKAAL